MSDQKHWRCPKCDYGCEMGWNSCPIDGTHRPEPQAEVSEEDKRAIEALITTWSNYRTPFDEMGPTNRKCGVAMLATARHLLVEPVREELGRVKCERDEAKRQRDEYKESALLARVEIERQRACDEEARAVVGEAKKAALLAPGEEWEMQVNRDGVRWRRVKPEAKNEEAATIEANHGPSATGQQHAGDAAKYASPPQPNPAAEAPTVGEVKMSRLQEEMRLLPWQVSISQLNKLAAAAQLDARDAAEAATKPLRERIAALAARLQGFGK